MAEIQITMVDTQEQIEGKILNGFLSHLNTVFHMAAPAIQRRIQVVCDKMIMRSPAYHSLLGGELLGELGVPDIVGRLDAILKVIRDGITVSTYPVQRVGNYLQGGMVASMVRADFMDILGLPQASYQTVRGVTIPWLEWLIAQGDRIIVIGFDVDFKLTAEEKARSRTGLALMTRGAGWRVPPEFSGTLDNNFITRAFNQTEVEGLLSRIFIEEIKSRT